MVYYSGGRTFETTFTEQKDIQKIIQYFQSMQLKKSVYDNVDGFLTEIVLSRGGEDKYSITIRGDEHISVDGVMYDGFYKGDRDYGDGFRLLFDELTGQNATPGAVTDQQEEEKVQSVREELSVTQIDMYYPGDHLTTFMEEEDLQNVLDLFRKMKVTQVDPVEKSGFMFRIDIIYENGERDDTVIDGKHIVVNGVHDGYYRCARSYCEDFRKLYEKFSKKQSKG